jgi:1-acyl-sn-glycerol-3-phosphate acyltransferase
MILSHKLPTISILIVALLVVALGVVGLCYADYLEGYRKFVVDPTTHYYDSVHTIGSAFSGIVLVFLLQFWPHLYRCRALIPFAAILLVIAWSTFMPSQLRGGEVFACLHSIAAGLAFGVALRTLLPFGTLVRLMVALPATFLVVVFWFYVGSGWDSTQVYDPPQLLFASVVLFVASIVVCARPLFELLVEGPTRVMYRVRAKGPGTPAFPARGPVMVLANHAAYLDPLFLGGDIPRPLTPMMTSKFYDKWFIYPIVKYLLGVIRVPEVAVRRQAPELALAIRALDEGKCLVIFPEGYLQRKADQPLRRFGRGVWEILKARPETPVVTAWIEGNWGSYFSYFNGPPMTGKKPDFRRPITIGYTEPFTVPKDVLEDHWATRFYLMNQVGGARALVGLPRIPEEKLPEKEEKGDQKDAEIPEDA